MRHVMLLLIVVLCSLASAEIPQMMSYQGKVTNAAGDPVADGTYAMQFRIYEVDVGGSSLWDSGHIPIAVTGGIFSVLLGEPPQPPLSLQFQVDLWLEVIIEGDVQAPRQPLASVGYAYMASGLVPGTEVAAEITAGCEAAIKGTNLATTGYGRGLYGQSASTQGRGVWGLATATTGINVGAMGETASTQGWGVWGFSTATEGQGRGVFGLSKSETGSGVYGYADATTGANYGVYAHTLSSEGTAVCGRSSATSGWTLGGLFEADSPLGSGVWGHATTTIGPAYGVKGSSNAGAGAGVYGEGRIGVWGVSSSGASPGVYGEGHCGVRGRSTDTAGCGVEGHAAAMSGVADGIRGETESPAGRGVYGVNTATTGLAYGVYGASSSTGGGAGVVGRAPGYGMIGEATAVSGWTYGLWGQSHSPTGVGTYGKAHATTGIAYGVLGESNSTSGGVGVVGHAPHYGMIGEATGTTGDTFGVWGWASGSTGITWGVFGESASSSGGAGVVGKAREFGVIGEALSTAGYPLGVWGITNSSGGFGVYSSGDFAASGTKSCVVKTSKGPTLMYCQESPENWFEDFGEGQLVNGRCHVELDPVFLETVTIDPANPMHVFVELHDESEGVYVRRGSEGFDVIELRHRSSGTSFSYRVVAKRKGYETDRLDYCKAAETDAYLYPELREERIGGFASRQSAVRRPAAYADGSSKHRITTEVVPTVPTADSAE